jgi:hypothetical protein
MVLWRFVKTGRRGAFPLYCSYHRKKPYIQIISAILETLVINADFGKIDHIDFNTMTPNFSLTDAWDVIDVPFLD